MKTKRLTLPAARFLALGLVVLFMQAVASSDEKLPKELKVVQVEAFPGSIELKHSFDYRQLLITGRLASGETVDLTRMAKLAETPVRVSVSPAGLVRPRQDGHEQLVYQFGNHSVNVPITVSGLNQQRNVSFVQDVQPVLSQLGCNAGTCHGSKDGKNGFKLSLRGYDPIFDHRALTDDVASRRFNRAAPDQSLMLLKSTGTIPHVGGAVTSVDSPYYKLLREWIANGAKLDLEQPRVTSIQVLPQNPILPRAGLQQQMVVVATYSDGTSRDVTAEAFVESGDIEVIEALENGLLKLLRRGEAPVLVRYEGAYAATTLTVMGDRTGYRWQQPPTHNYIDEHVYDKLRRVKILPSELCGDSDFIRRVYLDLTGLPPAADQVRAFLADPRDTRTKRDALIDQLIGSAEYIEHWTNKWADLLQVNRKFLGEEGAVALRNWIKDAVATNKPYDQLAREILTASGSTIDNPPAAYYKVLREPADLMENTTHLFLAVRFNCNKCHDHPFERWTQDQYYNLAAYFAQIGRKEDPTFRGRRIGGTAVEGAKPLVEVVYDVGKGEVTHERTGEISSPAFPYEHEDVIGTDLSRRAQLAQWITSPENKYFARSYVNRLWGYLFGVGIIEPIDDIRAGNPPTNPKLLDAMEQDFVASGFDVQHVLKTICKSRTYQHSIQTNEFNEDDEINYSHALPRRLPAEVLYDAIHFAAGSQQKIPGVPVGFRAAELPDAGVKVPFLDDFGRPVRESSCECERSSSMVLGPIMKLVNGPTIAKALADRDSDLARLVEQDHEDGELLDEIFLRFLARYPTKAERELGFDALRNAAAEHADLEAELRLYEQGLPAKIQAWEQQIARKTIWSLVDVSDFQSQVGADFAKQDDKSILVSGKNGKDTYTLTAMTKLANITGIRLEALPDAALPAGGPGRAQNGNFVLNEFTVAAASEADPQQTVAIKLHKASASFSQSGWDVAGAIDGNPASGWAVSPQFKKAHTAVFQTVQDVKFASPLRLTFKLSQQFQDSKHSLGRFRLAVTQSPRPVRMQSLPVELAEALAIAADQRTAAQQTVIQKHYAKTDKRLLQLRAQVARLAEQAKHKRLTGVQDIGWALINNPAFLFNR